MWSKITKKFQNLREIKKRTKCFPLFFKGAEDRKIKHHAEAEVYYNTEICLTLLTLRGAITVSGTIKMEIILK